MSDNITMWLAEFYTILTLPKQVEVTRFNDKSVWFPSADGERRRARFGEYESYHETFEDATDAMLERSRGKIEQALRQVEAAQQSVTYYRNKHDKLIVAIENEIMRRMKEAKE